MFGVTLTAMNSRKRVTSAAFCYDRTGAMIAPKMCREQSQPFQEMNNGRKIENIDHIPVQYLLFFFKTSRSQVLQGIFQVCVVHWYEVSSKYSNN